MNHLIVGIVLMVVGLVLTTIGGFVANDGWGKLKRQTPPAKNSIETQTQLRTNRFPSSNP